MMTTSGRATRDWTRVLLVLLAACVASGRQLESADSLVLPLVRSGPWYVANVSVGASPVRFIVDTGSDALWVRAAVASQSKRLVTPTSFLAAKSHHFKAQYGRGAVEGEVQEMAVALPGAAQKCQLGVADKEDTFWKGQVDIDGMMGLACGSGAAESLDCILHGRKRMFSLQLSPEGGQLTLGSMPTELLPSLTFMPSSGQCGHWTVPMTSVSINDGDAQKNRLQSVATAIIDSGTRGIVGPTFAVIALVEQLGAKPAAAGDGTGGEVSFYTVPCAARVNLPGLSITLGSSDQEVKVTLDGEALVDPAEDNGDQCHFHLAGWETDSWILGAAFLTKLRGVMFNVDARQVAIAT